MERRLRRDITGSNSQRRTEENFRLYHKVRTTVLPGDEKWTPLGGAAEGLEQPSRESALFARHLQHVVPDGVGSGGMATLAEMEAVLREEPCVGLTGSRAGKVFELRERLHVYREGLKFKNELY